MTRLSKEAQGLIDIGALAFAFAKVNRVTMHEDGVRYESDTDHTVMLSLASCSLASSLYKDTLDIGKVAQFALVHDLVEVYAGDTNTINLTDEVRALKKENEEQSFLKIKAQFSSVYPWIGDTIEEYENLSSREARFVKTLDKSMTKVTNILNKGAALRVLGTSYDDIREHFRQQLEVYKASYGKEFPEVMTILEELMVHMLTVIQKP